MNASAVAADAVKVGDVSEDADDGAGEGADTGPVDGADPLDSADAAEDSRPLNHLKSLISMEYKLKVLNKVVTRQ